MLINNIEIVQTDGKTFLYKNDTLILNTSFDNQDDFGFYNYVYNGMKYTFNIHDIIGNYIIIDRFILNLNGELLCECESKLRKLKYSDTPGYSTDNKTIIIYNNDLVIINIEKIDKCSMLTGHICLLTNNIGTIIYDLKVNKSICKILYPEYRHIISVINNKLFFIHKHCAFIYDINNEKINKLPDDCTTITNKSVFHDFIYSYNGYEYIYIDNFIFKIKKPKGVGLMYFVYNNILYTYNQNILKLKIYKEGSYAYSFKRKVCLKFKLI